MNKIIAILITTSILFTACQGHNYDDLAGNWQAVELTQEGDSLSVDLKEVAFNFNPNGRYEFESTLNYKEAGTFRLEGPYLFSKDTTRSMPKEKAVEIIQLAGDTLILRMEEAQKERIVVLKRN